MSWMKTNMKMMMDESDKTVADLITDGCNMGVKSLSRYLNQYNNAHEIGIVLLTTMPIYLIDLSF